MWVYPKRLITHFKKRNYIINVRDDVDTTFVTFDSAHDFKINIPSKRYSFNNTGLYCEYVKHENGKECASATMIRWDEAFEFIGVLLYHEIDHEVYSMADNIIHSISSKCDISQKQRDVIFDEIVNGSFEVLKKHKIK